MASDDEIKQRIVDLLLDHPEWFNELATKNRQIPCEISHSGVAIDAVFDEYSCTVEWEHDEEGWWPRVTVKFRLNIELADAFLRSRRSTWMEGWSMKGNLYLRGLEDTMEDIEWGQEFFCNGEITPVKG